MTNLSPSMLYLLSAKSTPTPLAQEVLNRAATDEPFSLNEVQQRLVQDKQAKRRVNAPGISETQDSSGPPEPLVQRGADRDGSASTTEPLGEIKRLMATAGDPLDVIKALLLQLDDVDTERFNTWFAAHIDDPAFLRVAA